MPKQNAKTRKGQKNIKNAATRGTENQNETPITKIHNPLRVGTGGCLEKSLLKERKCKHVSRVNT